MNKYFYRGPVVKFDICIVDYWTGETMAVSESKARNNLAYKFKKENDLSPNAKISLPGKIKMVEEARIS